MTQKQMDMYIRGEYREDLKKVEEYEKREYKKAFLKGTQAGWKAYRRNVQKKVEAFNDVYGIGLSAEVLMR